MATDIYRNETSGLYVNSMWGGTERGQMHQITVGNDYVQITPEELKRLRDALVEYFVDKGEYP